MRSGAPAAHGSVLANSKMSFVLSVNSSEFEQQNRFRQHYRFCIEKALL